MSISRADAQAIWTKVVANGKALDACPGPHRFADITPEKKIGKRYRCTTCGGEAESLHVSWYERGLKHAAAPVAPPRETLATLPEKP